MVFDAKKYADAMDRFHILIANVSELDSPEIGHALEEVCRVLRVAKVDMKCYDAISLEKRKNGNYFLLYEGAEPDENRVYIKRESTDRGNVVIYSFYKINDGVEWNEEESKRVGVLQTCLFAYNARARLAQIADQFTFHDTQLGMYNLNFLMKHAGALISEGTVEHYGVCYFNLKHFSVVNQRFGRDRGTKIMVDYIGRLETLLGDTELVCRVGGDNFIVLFLKEKLESVIRHMEGVEIATEDAGECAFVSAIAGYYMVNQPVKYPSDLMDRANVALNVAKYSKTTDRIFYSEALLELSNERKRIETMFPDAMRNEEFKVYYQPKVFMKDYKLKGAEALCRWYHEDKIVPPDEFIPVLEQSKDICDLDFYMLDHVCADIRRWMDEGRRVVKVSVNLSRCHLGNSHLLQSILDIIDSHNVPHEYIEIELTETTTDVSFNDLKDMVNGLREHGISTSVDDFGVGYSSFNLIREIPWNVIKIDKSFLHGEGNELSGKNRAMLKYVIAIAQEMGMVTICEGVETIEQVKLLKEFGCFMAQGFYFDKPLPRERFEEKL
ncbi:MAG: GGDEF domain-containing phosphodiesterase [Lachnospiraceae bacterium]|jgi:diguanylate cyclase (GGDEF) domain|nr:GGDEF domain-containing phosphodiesterase [Lachnospiraceae bacterium]